MVGTVSAANRIDKWSFKLKPKRSVWLKQAVQVSYRPEGIKKGRRPAPNSLIHPRFNNDRLSYTPAFQLPSCPVENHQQLLLAHQRKIQSDQRPDGELLFPKPASKNLYCAVCRKHYDDYLQHISDQSHLRAIDSNYYNTLLKKEGQRLGRQREQTQRESMRMQQQQLFKCLNMETISEGQVCRQM